MKKRINDRIDSILHICFAGGKIGRLLKYGKGELERALREVTNIYEATDWDNDRAEDWEDYDRICGLLEEAIIAVEAKEKGMVRVK